MVCITQQWFSYKIVKTKGYVLYKGWYGIDGPVSVFNKVRTHKTMAESEARIHEAKKVGKVNSHEIEARTRAATAEAEALTL